MKTNRRFLAFFMLLLLAIVGGLFLILMIIQDSQIAYIEPSGKSTGYLLTNQWFQTSIIGTVTAKACVYTRTFDSALLKCTDYELQR
jgi:hypothetical protein